MDAELQQRAVEYFHLPSLREEVSAAVLEAMPAFPERESALENLLKKASEEATDKEVFGKSEEKEKTADGEGDDDGFEGSRVRADAPAATAPTTSAAPAGRAASVSGGDVEDLLGMGDAPAPAPAPAAASSAPITNRIGIDEKLSASGQVVKWFNAALTRPSGSVLYEDSYVQVCVDSLGGCSDSFLF